MSQEITTLTATAAISGDPTASTPRATNKTPHTIDNVEACRTMSDGFCCAIEASSTDGRSLRQEGCEYHWCTRTTRGAPFYEPPQTWSQNTTPSPDAKAPVQGSQDVEERPFMAASLASY